MYNKGNFIDIHDIFGINLSDSFGIFNRIFEDIPILDISSFPSLVNDKLATLRERSASKNLRFFGRRPTKASPGIGLQPVPDEVFVAKLPKVMPGKYRYYSRSSSTSQITNKDGSITTKRRLKESKNGVMDEYNDEYIIDKYGKKRIIKEVGNKELLTRISRLKQIPYKRRKWYKLIK